MEKKKQNFFVWTTLVLMVLNVILLLTIWRGHHPPEVSGHPGKMPPPPHGGPAERIIRELQFNEEQAKKFEALKEEHMHGIKVLRDKGRSVRDDLFEELKQDQIDSARVSQLSDSVAQIQKQIELFTFDHFEKVKAICTTEQQKKFNEIISELVRGMMKGPRHEPMPGRPPHPDGPHPPHP